MHACLCMPVYAFLFAIVVHVIFCWWAFVLRRALFMLPLFFGICTHSTRMFVVVVVVSWSVCHWCLEQSFRRRRIRTSTASGRAWHGGEGGDGVGTVGQSLVHASGSVAAQLVQGRGGRTESRRSRTSSTRNATCTTTKGTRRPQNPCGSESDPGVGEQLPVAETCLVVVDWFGNRVFALCGTRGKQNLCRMPPADVAQPERIGPCGGVSLVLFVVVRGVILQLRHYNLQHTVPLP